LLAFISNCTSPLMINQTCWYDGIRTPSQDNIPIFKSIVISAVIEILKNWNQCKVILILEKRVELWITDVYHHFQPYFIDIVEIRSNDGRSWCICRKPSFVCKLQTYKHVSSTPLQGRQLWYSIHLLNTFE
jgi:hypothetical protein